MSGRVTPRAADRLPGNTRLVPIPSHVLDIDRRIREGDEVWRGDPTMGLWFNPASRMFEVIGLDINGNPYIAATAPMADQRLLEQLVAGDWQRDGSVFDRVEAENAKVRADLDRRDEEQTEAMSDKLAWALKRDAGYLYNGCSRDLWHVDWSGSAAARGDPV